MTGGDGAARRPPPLVFLLHGDDEFEIHRQLTEWKAKVLDPNVGGLNIVDLDGGVVPVTELLHYSNTPPFLGERRLVVVEGIASRLERGVARRSAPGQAVGEGGESMETPKTLLEELKARLAQLPETTRLVFWERTRLGARHPLRKLVSGLERGKVVDMLRPRGDRAFALWVQERVQEKGGAIDNRAAMRLVELVGGDKQQLDQELEKLLNYVDQGAPITRQDVEDVASRTREESIFNLVDAVGQGFVEEAIRCVRDLLDEGQSPFYLHYMLTRQIRLILQTKELLAQRAPVSEIQSRLRLREFVAKKCVSQSKNFSFARLERAYQMLVEVDVALKTSRVNQETALYLLTNHLVQLAMGRSRDGSSLGEDRVGRLAGRS